MTRPAGSGFVATALLLTVSAGAAAQTTTVPELPPDFPQEDGLTWSMVQQKGLVAKLAELFLSGILRARRTGGVLRLAAGEVLRSPGRTSYTVGAVLLSLALVVGFSIAQTTFTRAFDAEFEDIVSADLYVKSATWRPRWMSPSIQTRPWPPRRPPSPVYFRSRACVNCR